ncbi:MAG TPA: ComEC/Rec2 family competence protein, partial [Candidatus Limnocylindria bacterium]|nr:ComEC/Rec2 family competence protein [Candidatus Limnocylindria bacterium]
MNRPGAAVLPGLLGGVLLGIAAADAGLLSAALPIVGMAGAGAWMIMRVSGRHAGWVVGVFGLAFLLGTAVGGLRGAAGASPTGPRSVASLPAGQPVRVAAVVVDEPMPRGDSLDVVVGDIRVAGHTAAGNLLVRVPRSVVVAAGDEIAAEVTIRARDPADADEASYRERLRRQGIGAIATGWAAQVVGHRSSHVADAFAGVRRWLLDGLVRTVPEPEASLGAGILLGVRAGIDPAIRDAFAVAGLSHVVAISGWNVAIVVALIASATRRLRERMGPSVPALVAASA